MAIAEPSTGDAPEIEDGLYEVTCVDVSDPFEELDFNGKKQIKKVRIFLQVHGTDDGEGNEIILDPKVNLKWAPGGNYPPSTLFTFATAMCGPQDPDIPFNTDNLLQKSARATIKTEPGKWPKVSDMMPLKKNGARAPAPSPTVDDAPFDTDDKPTLTDSLAEGVALSEWFESVKAIGYTPKEILDHAQGKYGKAPKDLTQAERDELSQELGV